MTVLEQLNRTILLCRDLVAEGLSDEEICDRFQSARVLCISDRRNLSSHGGQTALITLVSLLSRMGMQVQLDIPDIALVLPQPPLRGSSVREALVNYSEALFRGATVACKFDSNYDLIFVLGDSQLESHHSPCWRMSGGDWGGGLRMGETSEALPFTAAWPIGSMVSAALAANEAFKFAIRSLPLRDEFAQVLVEPSPYCTFSFDSARLPEEGLHLGEVDVISAGAIGQAALYALLRLPKVEMWGRIFDDDATGASNLNRNMLTLVSDVSVAKVQVVALSCGAKLRLQPVASRFRHVRGTKLSSRVLVGVDDIPSRWVAQRCAPGWLAVSGTSHFNVSSSSHARGEPCCGCLHLVDDLGGQNPIPTVSFVSFWAGLALGVRLVHEALGSRYPPGRQHLWLTPLRMDLSSAAMWMPVAARRDCPVNCRASRTL